MHHYILRQTLKTLSLFLTSLFSKSLENTLCLSVHPAGCHPCPPQPWSQGKSKGKLTKSLSEQAKGGLRKRVSLEVCPPRFIPPPSYPGFSPQDPSSDPFVGEKWSRSLEPANYRALTSALLSPKRWGTFQQLEDSSTGECLLFLFKLLLQLCLKRKHLFYGGHKTLQQ